LSISQWGTRMMAATHSSTAQPGAGCQNYAPATLDCGEEPCSYGWHCNNDQPDDGCVTSAQAALPPGYPLFTGCVGDPDGGSYYLCAFNQQIPYLGCSPNKSSGTPIAAAPVIACHTRVDGDAFCSAYLSQYVLGDGTASSKCVSACATIDSFDGTCSTTTGGNIGSFATVGNACRSTSECDGIAMCVARDGQSKCELPCASP
jgi:hypothetical protein